MSKSIIIIIIIIIIYCYTTRVAHDTYMYIHKNIQCLFEHQVRRQCIHSVKPEREKKLPILSAILAATIRR